MVLDAGRMYKSHFKFEKKFCFSFYEFSRYIGMQGGQQTLSLQSGGCTYTGTAMHELTHALGFWHEQSRGLKLGTM